MCKKNVMIGVLLAMLLLGSTVVQAERDVFSVNFYYKPWPWPDTDTHNITLEDADQSAGFGDWLTDGWQDIEIPWNEGPQDPVPITSKKGETATFTLTAARNGGSYSWDQVRTTLLGDGNGDMMDGHANGTEDADELFEMTVSDIPFNSYDVIIYMGSQSAQFGDGTGKIVFNGVEQDYTLISGAFDGTFTEIVDATTPGNYIVYEGLKDSSFTVQAWGNGFNHISPCGFQFRQANPGLATGPSPDDEATEVLRDVVLNWTPGDFAAAVNGHTVYLSESFDDVNDGVGGITQNASSYDAGRLKFETLYYWRVDEVNAPPNSTVYPGDVWSFTTELLAYPIPGESITATASSQQSNQEPEKTIDNSGVDANDLHSTDPKAMWISEASDPGSASIQYEFDKPYKLHEMLVWNYNGNAILTLYGLKEVTIEYSTDGNNWSQLENVPEFAQAIGDEGYAANTTVAFNDVAARYVKITANSNWGGGGGFFNQYGLSEVRFTAIPVSAQKSSPDSGATGVDVDVILGWKAGREAVSHDVYVSADPNALILTGPVTETAFDTTSLDLALDQTYHWRVDEVNDVEPTTTWQGDLWSFTTQEYRVVDDFESYNDLNPDDPESNRIFLTWIGGDVDPANGSQVGHDTFPFAEHTIVYDGDQSMPFYYNNTIAGYSEALVNTDDLAIGRDWTKGSPTTMLLRFYGDPNNALTEQLYVKIGDTRFDYPGDVAALAMPRWSEWPIDLTGMDLSNITELAIGFARLGVVGGQGTVMIDAVWLNAASTMVPIFVPDAGFDDQVLGAGGYTYVGVGNYDGEALDYPGPWQSAGGDAWIHDHYYSDGLPARSGQNQLYGYEENEDYVYQILDETFIEGVTYTLSVWVGQAWSDEGVDWQLYFFTEENHQNNLIEASGNAPVGSWEQVSLVYTATAADAGNKIGIKMKGDPSLGFEDVTLFHSVPVVTLQPTVWTEKASYSPNEPIVVHFTNAAGNSTDWVGFFVDGDTSENYIEFIYLDGVIDGSVTYDAGLPTPGTYNVRLLFNDSYTVEADNIFTIE